MDISFTVCSFVFVCTVTDFPSEGKASNVQFCTVVQEHPGQGISHFGELSPSEAQNRRAAGGRRIGMCG